MATLNTLPDELTNKIIMMAIPTYAFMDELKTTRFVRWGCDCEGCTHKHYYGCYYYRDFNYRLKPTNSVIVLSNTTTVWKTDDMADDSDSSDYS